MGVNHNFLSVGGSLNGKTEENSILKTGFNAQTALQSITGEKKKHERRDRIDAAEEPQRSAWKEGGPSHRFDETKGLNLHSGGTF